MAQQPYGRALGALAATLIAGIGLTTPAAQATTQQQAPAARKVVFHGDGLQVRLGHDPRQLRRTSPSFRPFVHRELRELWASVDNRPACRPAPLVAVQEFRTSGFATLSEGVYFAPHHPECARGGYEQFAVRRDGRWIAPRALAGQDVLSCHVLRKWDIPRMSGAKKCYDGTEVVPYR